MWIVQSRVQVDSVDSSSSLAISTLLDGAGAGGGGVREALADTRPVCSNFAIRVRVLRSLVKSIPNTGTKLVVGAVCNITYMIACKVRHCVSLNYVFNLLYTP